MRLGPIFRVLGALLYGFIGYELGIALVGSFELTAESAPIVWGATLGGVLVGFLLAPWLVIAPAKAALNGLRNVPMPDLVAGTIGLAVGLLIAALLAYPIARLPAPFGTIMPFVAVIVFGYLSTAVLVLRQEDFYAFFNFRPRGKGQASDSDDTDTDTDADAGKPIMLLDTSVIIDGRIADIAETGFLMGVIEVPRFVLNELQYIADSSDALRRNRGRRGLEILDRLQNSDDVEIIFIDEDPQDAQQVDDKLISLARIKDAAILTNDYNLNRVAQLQGVNILNINELANAVKSVLLPGEDLPIRIIQEGKEQNQGVGYLDDGTMVVVENGRRYLNQEILVQVTKVLQTNAGRLIFAAPEA